MEEAQSPGSRCSGRPSSLNSPIFSRRDIRVRHGRRQYYINDDYCRFAVPDQHDYANCLAGDGRVGLCEPEECPYRIPRSLTSLMSLLPGDWCGYRRRIE